MLKKIPKNVAKEISKKLKNFECKECHTKGSLKLTGEAMNTEETLAKDLVIYYPFVKCEKCGWSSRFKYEVKSK